MAILESSPEHQSQTAADGRFSLYRELCQPNIRGELSYALQLGTELPLIAARAAMARQELDSYTEEERKQYDEAEKAYSQGRLPAEQRALLRRKLELEDDKGRVQDAESVFRHGSRLAVGEIMKRVVHHISVDQHSYWLRYSAEDARAYLCSTDLNGEAIIYFGRDTQPTDEPGSRLATDEDYLCLLRDACKLLDPDQQVDIRGEYL